MLFLPQAVGSLSTPLLLVGLGPLGLPELIILAGILVLIFGARKLPELGRGLGEGINNFKRGLKGDENKIEDGSSGEGS